MAEESPSQPADAAGPTRSAGDVLLAFLEGSVMLPLLGGMAKKAGEDLYEWVRRILSGKKARTAEEHLLDDGQVALVDTVRRVVFQLPADLTDREAVAILQLRLPTDSDAWLLVRKDYARRVWVIEPTDGPPARAIDTTAEQPPAAGARE
ncbi:hypothetical protein [Streptomyces sp. NPDC046727]|uniref:hypothetical protein n=1 Tax=Streptomyces sp. NPDC046727 TaxID=3155373 RepID=UPI0033D164B6